MVKLVPNMQITIHFLNFLLLRWSGLNTITPIIPLMTGLPPTILTAKVILLANQGCRRKERVSEIALKIPK